MVYGGQNGRSIDSSEVFPHVVPRDTEPMVNSFETDLQILEQRIVELEAENAQLRDAANAFGELAERLNAQLRGERLDSRPTSGSRVTDS